MSFLVGPLDDLFRFAHIGAAIVWVGLLHFMVYIRPAIFSGLTESTTKEVLPHLAARVVPWLFWGSLVTVSAGLVLYVDRLIRLPLASIQWELHAGALLGVVMLGLGHAVILPALRRVAQLKDGAAPLPAGLLERTHKTARMSAVLSWVVLALMVLGSH